MPVDENAMKYLKGAKGAPNVYDHVASTILQVLSKNPAGAHELYEHLSQNVKDSATSDAGLSLDEKLAKYLAVALPSDEQKNGAAAYLQGANSLFPKTLAGGDEPKESHPVRDFIQDASLFEWAGFGFGSEESYRVHLSLKRLASDLVEKGQPIDGLRFWGKILGTGGDYYIAETGPQEVDAGDEENPDLYINAYTYHVCSSAGGAWSTLPNLTSAQVLGARSLRRFFTGELEAAVPGNPPFPGVEKNLLRAQIAEINADTVVVPKGFFVVEDEEQLSQAPAEDELPLISTAGMLEPSTWEHMFLEINSKGRTTRMPEELDEEGDVVVDPTEPEQKRALRNITEDDNADKVWTVREKGGVVAVRNLRWPGSCTAAVASGSVSATPAMAGEQALDKTVQYASIYVGYGFKAAVKSFTPQMPQAIATECVDEMAEEPDVVAEPVREEEDDE